MSYYPVFLDLAGKRAVVVGGGKVAERKVLSLVHAGADVTVVSPRLTPRLGKEKATGRIAHVGRGFTPSDVQDAFVVIAATDSEEINRLVAENSPGLVNVVDVPQLCTFIAPSVVARGELKIAISTGGASPALARTIRQELQRAYGPEFAGFLSFLRLMRKKAFEAIPDTRKRQAFLKYLGSEAVLTRMRSRGLGEARAAVRREFEKRSAKRGPKSSLKPR